MRILKYFKELFALLLISPEEIKEQERKESHEDYMKRMKEEVARFAEIENINTKKKKMLLNCLVTNIDIIQITIQNTLEDIFNDRQILLPDIYICMDYINNTNKNHTPIFVEIDQISAIIKNTLKNHNNSYELKYEINNYKKCTDVLAITIGSEQYSSLDDCVYYSIKRILQCIFKINKIETTLNEIDYLTKLINESLKSKLILD